MGDPFFGKLLSYGDFLQRFPRVSGIPDSNLAKVIRYIAATKFDDEICLINDIDLMPLRSDYTHSLLENRIAETLMCVGREVYAGTDDLGKFPAGYIAAEGRVFQKLINPEKLDYQQLIQSWIGLHEFDHKEDISRVVHHENPDCFSDESLIRALIHRTGIPTTHLPRGFIVGDQSLDRSMWNIDQEKLRRGHYIEAHLPRPYSQHRGKIDPLLEYLGA